MLLNPGPVNLDERVRGALTIADMCHREPQAYAILAGVRSMVTKVAGGTGTHSAVVLTGSGTSALEATVCSVVPADGGLLALANGHFGERIATIAELHDLRTTVWNQGWGTSFDLEGIERLLAAESSITHVAVVHHETSTGQLNNVSQIGELVAAAGRSLIVDAVSSLGGEDLDVSRDHIDWCVASSNKCIEAPPGLAFVIGSAAAIRALRDVPERSMYLSLRRHFEAQKVRGVPQFTPAVQLMASALRALELLLAEGVLERRNRYRRLAETLRGGLEQLGLSLYLPDPPTRSSCSTNVGSLRGPRLSSCVAIYAMRGSSSIPATTSCPATSGWPTWVRSRTRTSSGSCP